MTNNPVLRAAHLLALCASGNGETLAELAAQRGLDLDDVRLARQALVASLGGGNWRASRAEAEAKLRTGWQR